MDLGSENNNNINVTHWIYTYFKTGLITIRLFEPSSENWDNEIAVRTVILPDAGHKR